jgi:hypothetical protein
LKKVFEKGDELEKMTLSIGTNMDLPINDALKIDEIWVLRICAWNGDVVYRNNSSYVLSSEKDEMSGSDESGERNDGTVTKEVEELRSNSKDEVDEWATALTLIPPAKFLKGIAFWVVCFFFNPCERILSFLMEKSLES